MAVTSSVSSVQYNGNGATTVFAYTFEVFDDDDLVVNLVNSTTGAATLQVRGTHYEVNGVGLDAGGNVTFTTAPASGYVVDIRTDMDLTQPTVFRNQGAFLPSSHEQAMDRIVREIIQVNRRADLAVRLPDLYDAAGAVNWDTLLSLANRKGKYFGYFNATTGAPELYTSIGATALSQSVIGQYLYPQTAAELAAGVTPSNYAYPPGDVRRYGAVGDGTTNDTTALANALLVGGRLMLTPGATYLVSSQLTISVDRTDMVGFGATIKAANSTNYEHVLYATGRTGIAVRGLTVDVNQSNRSASLTTRSNGIYLDGCTEPLVDRCTVKNAIGSASVPGIGIAFAGNTLRGRIANCVTSDCGVSGKAADGIYTSGTQNLVTDCIAINCNDTGAVIESSNHSGIIGLTTRGCGAVFAITNATNTAVDGNYADAVTGYDWTATVTGGIQIGNPLSTSTGNLRNTRVSNVTLHNVSGTGPALNVRATGSAITAGLTLSNIRINGAGAQPVIIDAEDVLMTGCDIVGSSNNNAVQIQSGSARVQITNNSIRGQFTIGIYSDGSNDVNAVANIIDGDGVNSTTGIYFAGTASRCRAINNFVSDITVARVGSDAGTTPTVWAVDQTSATHAVVHTKAETQLLAARQTGYTNPMTGTANRATSYATGSITLVQLAERVKALQDDLTTHGLIGA